MKKEAAWVIGGALVIAAGVLAWAWLTQQQHILPFVYTML